MTGNSIANNSGFSGKAYDSGKYTDFIGRNWPESKYYDLYEFGTTYYDDAAYARGKTGDATVETKSWNGDEIYFPYAALPWFLRGGCYNSGTTAGIFAFHRAHQTDLNYYSFRPVLVQK